LKLKIFVASLLFPVNLCRFLFYQICDLFQIFLQEFSAVLVITPIKSLIIYFNSLEKIINNYYYYFLHIFIQISLFIKEKKKVEVSWEKLTN